MTTLHYQDTEAKQRRILERQADSKEANSRKDKQSGLNDGDTFHVLYISALICVDFTSLSSVLKQPLNEVCSCRIVRAFLVEEQKIVKKV